MQTLRTFFAYCVSRKWIANNPAKELKAPRNVKLNEVVPYTFQEESQIIAAFERIGGGKDNSSGARYEQLRARAMILLLRQTALRISDVCTLKKDAVPLGFRRCHLARPASHAKEWRARLSADPRRTEADFGRAPVAAECRPRLRALFLERADLAPGGRGNRGTDTRRCLQEIRREERPCASLPAHVGNASPRGWRHVRAGGRYPGEYNGSCSEALRKVVEGSAGEH